MSVQDAPQVGMPVQFFRYSQDAHPYAAIVINRNYDHPQVVDLAVWYGYKWETMLSIAPLGFNSGPGWRPIPKE